MRKTFRPLAALVVLLACMGWVMAQQSSNPDQSQGQQQGQQANPSQQGQQQQAPAGQNPSATPNQNPGQNPSANPSGQAGAPNMPKTGSPLGLLVLLGGGAVGAGTAIRKRVKSTGHGRP